MLRTMTHIPLVLLVSQPIHTNQTKIYHLVNSEVHALLLYIPHFDVIAYGSFMFQTEPNSSTSVVYLVLVLKPTNQCTRKILSSIH